MAAGSDCFLAGFQFGCFECDLRGCGLIRDGLYKMASRSLPVPAGHSGHAFWHSGRELSEIWAEGVRFAGE